MLSWRAPGFLLSVYLLFLLPGDSNARNPTRVREKCNKGRPIDSSDVTLELFEPYEYDYEYDYGYEYAQAPVGTKLSCSSRQQLRGPTKVVMHGFQSSGESMKGFVEAYKGKSVNLIIVDWSGLAKIGNGRAYKTAATCALEVGKYVAKCLNRLNVDPSSLHLFGHSPGAPGVGMSGRELAKLGRKPSRVTGMDPAGPGFTRNSLVDLIIQSDFRITLNRELRGLKIGQDSGDFVDIVHTNIGVYGALPQLGHVDYYVNGGGPQQPNCRYLTFLDPASHSYAVNVAQWATRPLKMAHCAWWWLLFRISHNTSGNVALVKETFAIMQLMEKSRKILTLLRQGKMSKTANIIFILLIPNVNGKCYIHSYSICY